MKKLLLISLVLLGLLVAGYYEYVQLTSDSVLDLKNSHDEWTRNFIDNESSFADLVIFFKQNCTTKDNREIAFKIEKYGRVSLNVNEMPADLDSALRTFDWDVDVANNIKKKLLKVHCDCIKRVHLYDQYAIQIWPHKEEGTYYNYFVTDGIPADSVNRSHGGHITNSDFGKQVFLDYLNTVYYPQ
ncbi:hypothetical protein [Chitinophaga sancti]|uniref:hypothetical protein n=1 Tax=Chitinophaga sancti TaxID=1004 RepID=UPI003F79E117